MAVHDWTRVAAGVFHAFHVGWISEIQQALNGGLLPPGFYALAEQHSGRSIADILTLHIRPEPHEPRPEPSGSGVVAVAEAPPKVSVRLRIEPWLGRRRTLAIRHVSGHELIAMIEIASPANKDRPRSAAEFADKAAIALEAGISLVIVDLFPPGPHDPNGLNAMVWESLGQKWQSGDAGRDAPLSLAAYSAGATVDLYLEHVAPGAPLPEMPLFLDHRRYVNVPLEATYEAAFEGMPGFWRDVLEGRQAPPA